MYCGKRVWPHLYFHFTMNDRMTDKNGRNGLLDIFSHTLRDSRLQATVGVASLIVAIFTVAFTLAQAKIPDHASDKADQLTLIFYLMLAAVGAAFVLCAIVIALRPSPINANEIASVTTPQPAPSAEAPRRRLMAALGLLLFFLLGWIAYSFPWVLLAFAMGFPPSVAVSVAVIVLAGLTMLGILLTKNPVLGGFLGGAFPLGTLALYYSSINPAMKVPDGFAWFSVFAVVGGYFGGITALIVIEIMRFLNLRIPRH